ncbi:AMP-binding protein [Natrinema halophilum]|uniref:Acyl--CoA ligase n=1 Tax=Natrinema halophilum TaxID=1699371 RepID=A0A7D5GNY2_9EURY|nr:class I adenylate-forming enzyme family protein [Natrinema halophilum]QLG49793.1 acyl--CoA ligase [Natrinema halophilum]
MTLSLARRAEHFPDRTAVVDISEDRLYAPAETIDEDRITYDGLSTVATRTAARLSSRGIGPGDTVCLVTRNRVASLALFFACRRLGATLAPISHLLTPASVDRPFDVLEPELVVAEAAQRDLVRSIPFDRAVTIEELTETERAPVAFDDDRARTHSPLALHGVSGRPVARYSADTLERNCVTGIVAWGLAANDVVPLTLPLATADGFVRVALSVLFVGGTLLLDRAFDPGDAATAMAEADATFLPGREPAIRDIANASGFENAVDSLERVVCEGPVADDVVAAYHDCGVTVARAYGRLECPTALSQRFGADRGESDSTASVVGRPVPDCRARLIDGEDSVLEDAATGRLQLAGPMVADGYVTPSSTGDEQGGEPADLEGSEREAAEDRGRFTDGWFDTGQRFRRDEGGNYHLR